MIGEEEENGTKMKQRSATGERVSLRLPKDPRFSGVTLEQGECTVA